ncbi:hypothetical protein WI76_07710 [Burkholderia ubonensis]|uniref:hypothetical protein n=1 Tax=Burkholderia ubonensis TaxID=101571 RepID=UPI00075ECC09|nr:hypothetical protein [Burkholderia ubonensis]KVC84631.1 hypothetical protein WI76_07710 [Burkholderia ubonensis]
MGILKFGRTQFSEAVARQLNDIATSPKWREEIDEADKAKVAVRTELKQQLDTLNERFDAQLEQASAKRWEVERHLDDLRKRLPVQIREAEEACVVARGAVWAIEQAKGKEELDIKRVLYDSRDTRIDEYYMHISDAWNMINHLTREEFVFTGKYNVWTQRPILETESNGSEVKAAMDILRAAQKKVEELALMPLLRAEISERLIAISKEIAPTIKKFSLSCPVLNADGEVELSDSRLSNYLVLRANGVECVEDLPPPDPKDLTSTPASRIKEKRTAIAMGAGSVNAATIGDLGVHRARQSRSGGSSSSGLVNRSAKWWRNRKEIDDIDGQ